MRSIKKSFSYLLICVLLMSSALFFVPAKQVDASLSFINALPTQVNSINSFINDDRWKAGTDWGAIGPKLAKWWSCSGCCAYCADYVAYCYGIKSGSPWSVGSKFTNVNEIRAGDVITIGNPDSGSGHWFLVVERSGNSL